MKRIFLCAAAISVLCSSCESTDETFLKETNNTAGLALQAKQSQVTDVEIYENIMKGFDYNDELLPQENLLLFEQHVNRQMANYVQPETYKYETIDSNQLLVLEQADAVFIEQLAYSATAKKMMYDLLNNNGDTELLFLLENEQEHRLMEILFALQDSEEGDDDVWNGNRTIAFAYGAQYSFAQAVLYAGAVELKWYQ